ncbi:hypothetical protein MBM_03883 [Drepanopeziza brunnea f. sp. 'multigermtubi' MB_m1]|uniref:Uncharacterized protein n=1 Tax=Marssonina brunnea f. sp. multigermtubi (strain MB_m1) TaxID=1072389 RepID=K1WYP7_MARBU|nr:uncharacterized protein MBM_03883 [Drepanopeziza brunnea f. sp. 'multigermtubi' MB_m1]EKD18111.1 hypothetical protein MBM_03883 [Drepanopeziza brunnea f. sp. 'multigermtubi' MB_m1]
MAPRHCDTPALLRSTSTLTSVSRWTSRLVTASGATSDVIPQLYDHRTVTPIEGVHNDIFIAPRGEERAQEIAALPKAQKTGVISYTFRRLDPSIRAIVGTNQNQTQKDPRPLLPLKHPQVRKDGIFTEAFGPVLVVEYLQLQPRHGALKARLRANSRRPPQRFMEHRRDCVACVRRSLNSSYLVCDSAS